MNKNHSLSYASFYVALGIILGAFAAHGLKNVLEPEKLSAFKTGVLYHLLMGIVLFVLALWGKSNEKPFKLFKSLLWTGSMLFSFSIYLITLLPLVFPNSSFGWIGPITPLGGALMIGGFVYLSVKA